MRSIFGTRPTWKKSVRLLETGPLDAEAQQRAHALDYRRVDGGLLVQARDLADGDQCERRLSRPLYRGEKRTGQVG